MPHDPIGADPADGRFRARAVVQGRASDRGARGSAPAASAVAMARSAGLEPTASASAGLRSIQLSYERATHKKQGAWAREQGVIKLLSRVPCSAFPSLVPKGGFEPPRPYGHYALNVARLPFRHFGAACRRWSGPGTPRPWAPRPDTSVRNGGRYRARTCDLIRVKDALIPTELTAQPSQARQILAANRMGRQERK